MKVKDLVENPHLFKNIDIRNAYEFYDSYDEYLAATNKEKLLKFMDYEITDIQVDKANWTNYGDATYISIKKPK